MTQLAFPRVARSTRYRHEAVVWRGTDAFLGRTVPFVAEGVALGTPTMVAVTREHWARLSRALGSDARRVTFVDMAELGRNPARIIPAWLDFVAEHGAHGQPLRGISEPVWPGRRPAEVAEHHIHEALLNLAVPADAPLWLLCPYDADALSTEALAEVRRGHPHVAYLDEADTDDHATPLGSDGYAGREHGRRLVAAALPEPTVPADVLPFGRGDLAEVRALVARWATRVGLERNRIGDLVLAVNEVAANSLDHGGGSGVVRAWAEPGALVLEVVDAGRIANPLVGRVNPSPQQTRGRGLWMVNTLCDLLQIRSTDHGTTVRVVTWLSAG